ncbi:MAG TPA: nuclear transport factor 2 family protein [Bryobacteraceae bacterium]|nr:nuclear transport factor 2 family protein [Bryobacteraceae bacterium]
MTPGEVLARWLAAINNHDVSALAALMAPDFAFIDSLGNRVDGARSMEAGWRGYFDMCPDYWIRADYAMGEGDTMLLAGEAGGTIDGQSWRTPAAWKAVIRDGHVMEFRVFADNKPVYEILGKRR